MCKIEKNPKKFYALNDQDLKMSLDSLRYCHSNFGGINNLIDDMCLYTCKKEMPINLIPNMDNIFYLVKNIREFYNNVLVKAKGIFNTNFKMNFIRVEVLH